MASGYAGLLMTEPTEPTLLDLRAALAGTYDIEAPLGRGGMSFVYLARERRLDRRVAIKVLSPELAVDDAYRRLFLHEARTVAALTHPNIVPIHAVGEVGDFVFFAMAYVEGDTLAQRIATVGPLNPHRAARLLCDIGDALGFAHARGVVHRDVKPDNILIDAATGRALLSDFGIAHASPATVARLGRPAAPRGRIVGTAAFISPEQARGDAVDARSDLYSLGVVAFYVLSGQLPFNSATDAGFLVQHIAEPAPPLATVVPLVPPRVAQIVDRCLAKEPWARFADAPSLVRALADAVEPPPVPLAVRAFLVRSTHLDGPALIHAFMTGAMLLPATIAAWLSATTATVRGFATAALVAALIVPAAVAISRVRRLLRAAGSAARGAGLRLWSARRGSRAGHRVARPCLHPRCRSGGRRHERRDHGAAGSRGAAPGDRGGGRRDRAADGDGRARPHRTTHRPAWGAAPAILARGPGPLAVPDRGGRPHADQSHRHDSRQLGNARLSRRASVSIGS